MNRTILLLIGLAFLVTKNIAQTVTDYDGNKYNTVTIGTQVWLKENLKVTHYSNGDPIPNVIVDSNWMNTNAGAYSFYHNNVINKTVYGNFYNWNAIEDPRKICPAGYYVPTVDEWDTLIFYLGGENIAGGKLKEAGTTHWGSPNQGATNESGFSALPGGERSWQGGYGNMVLWGILWSSTKNKITNQSVQHFYIQMNYFDNTVISNFTYYKNEGKSVRCIKDATNSIKESSFINIQIYPNPATDKINIVSAIGQTLKMQVYNTVGQCILQRELNTQTNTIDISSLTRGIYILKLTSPNGTYEKKIIKE